METKMVSNDERGEIYTLQIVGKEYIILKTYKGYRRGGDYHESPQHDVVLEGDVNFYYRENGVEKERRLIEGDNITFPTFMPHYLESNSSSIVLEWLEGDFEKKYDDEFRRRVQGCLSQS